MDDTTKGSEYLTSERYKRQHRAIRKKLYCATPEGVAVTADGGLLRLLIDFLASKDAPPPPDELNERLGRIPEAIQHVALAILQPTLDAIARGWQAPRKIAKRADNWRMLLAKQMGEMLCRWLALKETEMAEAAKAGKPLISGKRRGPKSTFKFMHDDWTSSECVVAGDWMLDVVTRLSCFDVDEHGRLCIAPEWQPHIDKICEDLQWRHPVMLPHTEPPKPATGWWTNYSDRLRAPFVRDWRPETRKAVEATFASGFFRHADGVNALKAVPLRINQPLLGMLDKFAVELMGHSDDQRKADRRTVRADLRHVRWCREQNRPVYLDYSCDKRGRVYSEQQLNYAREDHVRALFEFERGEPLGADGLSWLEIHAANCEGSTDKKPWAARLRWAKENTDLIERVAADPHNNFDLWRGADKPFAFLAACKELSDARKDPAGFITHLPVGFDCTCNGIQNLAMLSRDEKAGRLVNLLDTDRPLDIYSVVTQDVIKLLQNEDSRLLSHDKDNAWRFGWWRERLDELNDRQRRKLFKTPTMTFPYASTVSGMADKIVETYFDLFDVTASAEAAMFLAMAVRLACRERLRGPTEIMKYVRQLALYRYKQEKFLEWRSPTGFPCANIYQEPNVIDIDLGYGGVRSRYTVADGSLPEMRRDKMLNAASPNFVHSLDAAHLMRTVLAANSEGIRDILTVHDSMACLAPHAQRFGQIKRREFATLYAVGDPLRALRDANVSDPKLYPLPPRGNLDPLGVQRAEYFSM
jgi:DNA-directed RNA polymerase